MCCRWSGPWWQGGGAGGVVFCRCGLQVVVDSCRGEAELFAVLDGDEGEERAVRCAVVELSVDAGGACEVARPGREAGRAVLSWILTVVAVSLMSMPRMSASWGMSAPVAAWMVSAVA